ncbi:MAG: type II toxin-antitoxin system MqsA family antitoxin [Calditrichota bacterium]
MKCAFCKEGHTEPQRTTITLQRGETTIIIKNVPADVCENCGEPYLNEENTDKVLKLAEEAVKRGAEIEIVKWAA